MLNGDYAIYEHWVFIVVHKDNVIPNDRDTAMQAWGMLVHVAFIFPDFLSFSVPCLKPQSHELKIQNKNFFKT